MDFIVFIADTAAAPPFIAALACSSMLLQLGVIFAMNGISVVSATALEYFSTSSLLVPTSDPIS